MELLRPCWKCGQPPVAGPAAVAAVTQTWVISCPRCGEGTDGFATIEAAAAAWNGPPPGGDAADSSTSGEGDEDTEPVVGLVEGLSVPV